MSGAFDALRGWLSRGGRGTPRRVVLYTRAGCGLCERARQLVVKEASGHVIEVVDIDADPELRDRYDVRVPVITVDGVEVAELEVRPGQVRAAIGTRKPG